MSPAHANHRRLLALLAAAICALLGATSAHASAASAAASLSLSPKHGDVRIVTPGERGMVRRQGRLRVRLNRRPAHSRVAVYIDGRAVRSRAGRTVADVGAARLKPGRHQVTVMVYTRHAGRLTLTRRFGVVARERSFLTRVSAKVARNVLCVGRRTTVAGVRAAGPPTRIWFTLDGRGVHKDDEWASGRVHAVELSPNDGLRYGRNVLRVEGYDVRSGRWDRQKITIVRRRGAPIAAAGANRRIRSRREVRLDAGASLASGKAADLAYTWRLLPGPNSGSAQLADIHAVKPKLKVARPGIYRLALQVQEVGAAAASARASANSVGASAGGSSSEDVVTLTAAPPTPSPAGAEVEISEGTNNHYAEISYSIPAAEVGGKDFRESLECPTEDVCTLQLNQTNLAVETKSVVPAGQKTPAPVAGSITMQVDPVHSSTVWVGTKQVAQKAGSWRLGPLTGDLQRDIAEGDTFYGTGGSKAGPRYTFNFNQFHTFTTRTQTEKTHADTFEVDGKTWSAGLDDAYSGFVLLALNANLEALEGTPVAYPTNGYAQSGELLAVKKLEEELQAAKEAGDVVLLQSVGAPHWENGGVGREVWDRLGQDLESQLGANADLFDQLGSTIRANGGNYAVVGNPNKVLEAGAGNAEADANTGDEGVLSGTLAPDASWQLVPTSTEARANYSAAAAAGNASLTQLAFGPQTAWPKTPGDAVEQGPNFIAAYDGILGQIGALSGVEVGSPKQSICPNAPDKLRAIYCADATTDEALLSEVEHEVERATVQGSGYGETELNDEKRDILAEVDKVRTVHAWVKGIEELLLKQTIEKTDLTSSIANDITAKLPQHGSTNTSGALNAFAALTAVAGVFFPPEAGADIVSFISNAAWSASAFAPGSDDENEAVIANITSSADNAAVQLDANFANLSTYMTRIGDLLVSDPAKLDTAAKNMRGDR